MCISLLKRMKITLVSSLSQYDKKNYIGKVVSRPRSARLICRYHLGKEGNEHRGVDLITLIPPSGDMMETCGTEPSRHAAHESTPHHSPRPIP